MKNIYENDLLVMINDQFIMSEQQVMADWLQVQDKLWEMDKRDKKFIEVDDVFEIDFI